MVCRLARARVDLAHALLDRAARIGQLLRSCRRTSASGRRARPCPAAPPSGCRSPRATWRTPSASTSSGRASWLPSSTASSTAPNTARNRRQRERADVHAAQALARQRALLVLAVGLLHGERVGDQRRRQRLRDLQEARLGVEARSLAAGTSASARTLRRRRAAPGAGVSSRPFDVRDRAVGAHLAQLLRRGPLGVELEARRRRRWPPAGRCRSRAPRRWRRAGRACARAPGRRSRRAPRPAGCWPLRVLFARSSDSESSVARPRFRPASSAPSTLTSNQLSIERDDELVGHDVDQHARHHADQREDRRQLDQQAAAELALAQPPQQPERDPADDQHQHHRDDHVDAEQPRVVALVERAVVGGLRQQEHQHQADGRHQRRADADGPAHGTRAPRRACGGPAPPRGSVLTSPSPAAAARCARRRCSSRPGRPRRSGTAAAAARYRAGSGTSRDGVASSPISAASPSRSRPTRLHAVERSARVSKFWFSETPKPALVMGTGDTLSRQRRVSGW